MAIVLNKTSFLDAPIQVESMHGVAFSSENKGHQFVISCMRGGSLVPLTGTVTAKFMRSNNTTILLAGSGYTGIVDGKATVTLHQDCYNIPGRFQLAIFLTENGETSCIYACVGMVQRTQNGELIDSGDVVPSLEELLEKIQDCEDATTAANTAAANATSAAQSGVRTDTAEQGLTDTQKSNARTNISAVSQEELGNLKSALDNVNEGYYNLNLIPDKYILRDNGNEANYNGWSATDYIPIPAKSLMFYFGSVNLVWGAKYDSNKDYVSSLVWNTQFNFLFNDSDDLIYFRTSGLNADMSNVKFKALPIVDTTLSKKGYPADAKTVGDRLQSLEITSEKVPNYYKTQLATKEAIIRGHFDDCAYDGDGIVFLTDTHFSADLFTSDTPTSYFNANNSFALIKDIISKCAIDKIVFGGDLVNSAPDVDTMLLCVASFGTRFGNRQNRLRYCIGNHEYYTGNDLGQTIKPTPDMLYGAGVKYNENIVLGKGDMVTYYFDNAVQKIRYYVVSCGRDTETTTTQIAWLLNAFKEIPANYKVVVIGHGFIADNMTAFRGSYAPIANALDAVKAKTAYVYNSVTYDYSALSNVDVVCMITGHTHIDGSITTAGGIPCICTTTDSYAQNYELVNGTPTKVERQKGTVNEQAFDIYQFDFTNRKIYVTRIGYGADREFSY